MAQKKNQHFVPVVHLRSFCDARRPADHPSDAPFRPRVWLTPQDLESPARARAPQKVFAANHFYTVAGDAPDRPQIEERLSQIETTYGMIQRLLDANTEFEVSQYESLLRFIGTLLTRQPQSLDHWQTQFENFERLHRMVERAHTGQEPVSDRLFWMRDETSRRVLLQQGEGYIDAVRECGWLLENQSSVPFVTSDRPVLQSFLHTDELTLLGFPTAILRNGLTRADRAFFSYCALTPRFALVASPLVNQPQGSRYRQTDDSLWVFKLNDFMRRSCVEHVVSSVPNPFAPLESFLRESDARTRRAGESTKHPRIAFYTADDRFRIDCSEVSFEDGPETLSNRIRFRPIEASYFDLLRTIREIREVRAIDATGSTSYMRAATILQIGASPMDDWIVESSLPNLG